MILSHPSWYLLCLVNVLVYHEGCGGNVSGLWLLDLGEGNLRAWQRTPISPICINGQIIIYIHPSATHIWYINAWMQRICVYLHVNIHVFYIYFTDILHTSRIYQPPFLSTLFQCLGQLDIRTSRPRWDSIDNLQHFWNNLKWTCGELKPNIR